MSIFGKRRRRVVPRSTGELLSQFADLDGAAARILIDEDEPA